MDDLLNFGRKALAAQGFSRLLGTELTAFEAGRAELSLALTADHTQQNGFAHGGVVAYLADNALTYAGGSVVGDGAVLTLEMKINYIRPGLGERLVARAEVISAGRRQAVVQARVFAVKDGEEKLIAAAQGTVMAVEGR